MKNISILLFTFFGFSLFGQVLRCGDKQVKNFLELRHPGFKKVMEETQRLPITSRSSNIYRIPVVVHIVYNSSEENLSDDLVRSQIRILNEDFRRNNADASNTRDIFKSVAGDAMIEFYLADKDPEGKPTNGITRTQTNKASFADFNVFLLFEAALECDVDFSDPADIEEKSECLEKFLESKGLSLDDLFGTIENIKYSDKGGKDPWDQKKYLNIWVGDFAINLLGQNIPFLLGFAYPPVGAPLFPEGSLPEGYEKNDGVAVHYQVFGINNPNIGNLSITNNSGRTCTHEVGHYLGLRHIWGDGDCTQDDGISDTPDAVASSQIADQNTFTSCTVIHSNNTCQDQTNDQPDMVENFMDYSPESCMNLFSLGQIAMMRSMLEGPRAELIGLQASTKQENVEYLETYPSVAENKVFFKTDHLIDKIQIVSLNGKLIETVRNSREIDVSNLSKGFYIIKYFYEGRTGSNKIIKI